MDWSRAGWQPTRLPHGPGHASGSRRTSAALSSDRRRFAFVYRPGATVRAAGPAHGYSPVVADAAAPGPGGRVSRRSRSGTRNATGDDALVETRLSSSIQARVSSRRTFPCGPSRQPGCSRIPSRVPLLPGPRATRYRTPASWCSGQSATSRHASRSGTNRDAPVTSEPFLGPLSGAARGAGSASLTTVLVAFAANFLVAVAKSVAAVVTGSASILAEAAHSWADTGNEVFLLIAYRRSRRPPDRAHPLGYGRRPTCGRCSQDLACSWPAAPSR